MARSFPMLSGLSSLTLVLACCGGGGSSSTVSMAPAPAPAPATTGLPAAQRAFTQLAFTSPVALLQAPSDSARWYVVEKRGTVRTFANDAAAASTTLYIDLSAAVETVSEGGLLGMAFHPNFPNDPRVFLYYTAQVGLQIVSRLSAFTTTSGGTTLNAGSETVLLTVNQPETNHKGGALMFGPDGYLYLGLGDGGGGGDAHGTIGNGQETRTLLGKILRIDINGSARPYGIPAGNPFAGNALCGATGTGTAPCAEIYHYGLRNPWRFSFDRGTGTLWIGDVGQDSWEEVDRADTAGVNFGWRCREGSHAFNAACGAATGLVDPVAEYGHSVGQSIIGGYVYRGSAFPAFRGNYVFADFVTGRLFAILAPVASAATQSITGGTATSLLISSFAEGVDGELYLLDYSGGGIYRVTLS